MLFPLMENWIQELCGCKMHPLSWLIWQEIPQIQTNEKTDMDIAESTCIVGTQLLDLIETREKGLCWSDNAAFCGS